MILLLISRLVCNLSSVALAVEGVSYLDGSGDSFRLGMSERATSSDA